MSVSDFTDKNDTVARDVIGRFPVLVFWRGGATSRTRMTLFRVSSLVDFPFWSFGGGGRNFTDKNDTIARVVIGRFSNSISEKASVFSRGISFSLLNCRCGRGVGIGLEQHERLHFARRHWPISDECFSSPAPSPHWRAPILQFLSSSFFEATASPLDCKTR